MKLCEKTTRAERDRLYSLLEDVLDSVTVTPALRERIETAMQEIDARHVNGFNAKIAKKGEARE